MPPYAGQGPYYFNVTAGIEASDWRLTDTAPATAPTTTRALFTTTVTQRWIQMRPGLDTSATYSTTSPANTATGIGWNFAVADSDVATLAASPQDADGPGRRTTPLGDWLFRQAWNGSTADTSSFFGMAFRVFKKSGSTYTFICGFDVNNQIASVTTINLQSTVAAVAAQVFEAGEVLHVEVFMRGRGGGTTGVIAQTITMTFNVTAAETSNNCKVSSIPSPGLRFRYDRERTGASTPAGAKILKPILLRAGTVTPSPGSRIALSKLLKTGTITPVSIVKATIGKNFTGAITPTAVVLKRLIRILAGSSTPGPGALVRMPILRPVGLVTPGPGLRTTFVRWFRTGSITPTATAVKQYRPIPKTGTITPGPGTLVRRPGKLLSATITPGPGTRIAQAILLKTGTITPAAQRVILVVKKFPASAITPAGAVTKQSRKFFTGSQSSAATLAKRPGKQFASAITPGVGTLSALLRKNFTATIASSGALRKTLFASLAGTITSVSAITRRIGRVLTGLIGPTEDYAVQDPTRHVAGIVKDQAGTPVAGATVKLFRVADDAYIASTTSAADGSYSFTRDQNDPFTYFVVAYEEVGTPTQGLTVRNLNPTVIP